jgi:gliding motility-associated-like protein
MIRKLFSLLLFLPIFFSVLGQENESIWMYPNRGQWATNIHYLVPVNQGNFYITQEGFSYHFYSGVSSHSAHQIKRTRAKDDIHFKGHVLKTTFEGATFGQALESGKSDFYRNYFIGDQSSTWANNVHAVNHLTYPSIYPAIDLLIQSDASKFKYSFLVASGGNPENIRLKTEGANQQYIDSEGNLHTTHRFGEILEYKPIAWQIDSRGNKIMVPVQFQLTNNTVSFLLPQSHDKTLPLIIDPELVFSTFIGSLSDSWGMTASPDSEGNIYTAGIVFGPMLPTTTGAYDLNYHGGETSPTSDPMKFTPGFDVCINKFSKDGRKLLFSTFLGGSGNETPHSLICNSSNDVYILGATSSPNFPTTNNAFDKTFGGGPEFFNNEIRFIGSDIYIAKISTNGNELLGSTYLGGSEIDGLNDGELVYNYGDNLRGEIILSKNNEILIASSTRSNNFPIINGSQKQIGGAQDAVICKLTTDLSQLIWSTYFGGAGDETGNSIQQNSKGELYVTGGTTSNGLAVANGYLSTYQGGKGDGYVIHMSQNDAQLLHGTYVGTQQYDQNYFVQVDDNDDVYLFGQTEGIIPITPGKYGNPNSGQYLFKLNPTLNNVYWTTTIGAGTNTVEISPTAFSISHCSDIYIAGWGGLVNQQNSRAIKSSTLNFPTTPDAFQPTTSGDNFYLGVLSKDATSLKYGTFMGGVGLNYNHVDGGTSRFDKNGGIYHAVCGACGGKPNGFTSTPGAYSTTNKSTNCNLAAFKFELNKTKAVGNVDSISICKGSTVQFSNQSINSDEYLWDFNDGSQSTDFEPSHLYENVGDYVVKLIASDSKKCIQSDSLEIMVRVEGGVEETTNPIQYLCKNDSTQLTLTGGNTYNWSPGNLVSDSISSNPYILVDGPKLVTGSYKQGCFIKQIHFPFDVFQETYGTNVYSEICEGETALLDVYGGVSYTWFPVQGLTPNASSNHYDLTIDSSRTYFVKIKTVNNCEYEDSVQINVIYPGFKLNTLDTVRLCFGGSYHVDMQTSKQVQWTPSYSIQQKGSTYTITPTINSEFSVQYNNACGPTSEKIYFEIHHPAITAGNDTSICIGDSAKIWAKGAEKYSWYTKNKHIWKFENQRKVSVAPTKTTTYKIIGIDQNQCLDSSKVTISIYDQAYVHTDNQIYAYWGTPTTLIAKGNRKGTYLWKPENLVVCSSCSTTDLVGKESVDLRVIFTDENGCKDSSITHVIMNSDLYVPNTFTPNKKDGNDVFQVIGYGINDFHCEIFNRWGELIYTMNDINESWDGTFNSKESPDGTYIWKIHYINNFGKKQELKGHINLLR